MYRYICRSTQKSGLHYTKHRYKKPSHAGCHGRYNQPTHTKSHYKLNRFVLSYV